MPSVQIKDVPEETHAVLRQRAAAAHQSLQEYLRARLIADAAQPTLEEVLNRAGSRSGGSVPMKAAVTALRRTVLVVDASVLVVALADDGPDGDRTRHRLRGERLVAPESIDLEIGSVLRRQNRSGQINDRRATQALDDLASTPLERAAHVGLLGRCWELRQNLTFYDAAYVALAEALQITLLTGDRRLGRATGPLCRIETIAS